MKAYQPGPLYCGACRWPMLNEEQSMLGVSVSASIHCGNRECPEHGVRYETPRIDLVRVQAAPETPT